MMRFYKNNRIDPNSSSRIFPMIFRIKISIRWRLSFLFGFWAVSAWTYPGDLEYIPPRDYAAVIGKELQKAKSSITVCLYLFNLRPQQHDSPVLKLAETLRKAHQSGVRVEVILDQNIPFTDRAEKEGDLTPVPAHRGFSETVPMADGKNAAAVRFLRAQCIPVFLDSAAVYTHSKVVVIDEETVILGSTNWTDTALNRNFESNVLIRSTTLAQKLLAEFRTIPRVEPEPEEKEVFLPDEFLWNERYFGRLARGDERAFDLYLWLVREHAQLPDSPTINPRFEDMAETLGIVSMGREKYRVQIRKTLTKLQNRYGLIQVEMSYGDDPLIRFTPLLGERTVPLPEVYWSMGWNQSLSLRAKALLLISQYEAQGSPLCPRWSAAQKTLSHRYHLSLGTLSEGVTELRRRNLIEIDYSPNVPEKDYRRASIYTSNPLYNPKELHDRFDQIRSKYGADRLVRAQRAAQVVYEDCDANAVEALIDLENQYGQLRVDAALRLITQKNPDNPLRSIAYLIATIKAMK